MSVGDEREKRPVHNTARGYATLDTADGQSEGGHARDKPEQAARRPSEHPVQKSTANTPLVEIEVVHEHGPAPNTEKPWRTVEIWTRNRVYALDSTLTCYEVTDRGSRQAVADHPFIGLRLVGGQHREGDAIELSYPFPRPGTEAVFEAQNQRRKAGGFSRTSAVARVILRLHIVTVSPRRVVPTWEEITGSFASPAMREDT